MNVHECSWILFQVFLLSKFVVEDAVPLFGDEVLAFHMVDAEQLELSVEGTETGKDAVGDADVVDWVFDLFHKMERLVGIASW